MVAPQIFTTYWSAKERAHLRKTPANFATRKIKAPSPFPDDGSHIQPYELVKGYLLDGQQRWFRRPHYRTFGQVLVMNISCRHNSDIYLHYDNMTGQIRNELARRLTSRIFSYIYVIPDKTNVAQWAYKAISRCIASTLKNAQPTLDIAGRPTFLGDPFDPEEYALAAASLLVFPSPTIGKVYDSFSDTSSSADDLEEESAPAMPGSHEDNTDDNTIVGGSTRAGSSTIEAGPVEMEINSDENTSNVIHGHLPSTHCVQRGNDFSDKTTKWRAFEAAESEMNAFFCSHGYPLHSYEKAAAHDMHRLYEQVSNDLDRLYREVVNIEFAGIELAMNSVLARGEFFRNFPPTRSTALAIKFAFKRNSLEM